MRRVGICVISVVVVGCGGATRVTLPVEKNKPANELTETELRDICKEGISAIKRSYGSDLCSAQGLGASFSNKGTCSTVRDECLGKIDASQCDEGEPQPIDCDVPVSEIEVCMNDMLAQLDNLPSISCSMTIDELRQIDTSSIKVSTPASCEALNKKCGNNNFGMDISYESNDLEPTPPARSTP